MYRGRSARTACTRRSTMAYARASSNSTMPTVCVRACLVLNSQRSSSPYSLRNLRRTAMSRSSAILSIDPLL